MARVTLFKNIFEDTYEDISVNEGTSVESVVRGYGQDGVYTSNLVECYDVDTGETIFVPISDEEDFSVVVVVNEKNVGLDYILQKDDVCLIFITPKSSGSDENNWSWTGAGWGTLIGLVSGAILGVATFGLSWVVAGIGAAAGAVIGFIAGGIVGANLENSKKGRNNRDGDKLPDLAGSANQPITGNAIPYVIGKTEIAPFIIGSPNVIYSGKGGKDAYIEILYAVGYAPLCITDFKFDCLTVTKNTRVDTKEIVYAGRLKDSAVDGGDIEVKWNANKVQFEILQQNINADEIYYGDIYPNAVKYIQVGATPMFIKDDTITDLEEQSETVKKLVQYSNGKYDSGFRTNSIRFSEQYPGKIEVILDFPEGIYKERSNQTNKDGSEYDSIPMWMAIQWRPFSESANERESRMGSGANYRSDPNYRYEFDKEISPDGWITFDYIIADSDWDKDNPNKLDITKKVLPETFTESKRLHDLEEHKGNKLSKFVPAELYSSSMIVGEMQKYEVTEGRKGKSYYPYLTGTVNYATNQSGEQIAVSMNLSNGCKEYNMQALSSSRQLELPDSWWSLCPINQSAYEKLPRNENGSKYINCYGSWPLTDEKTYYYGNESWENGNLFNLQEVEDHLKTSDGVNVSEFRVTAVADIKDFCEKNNLSPSDFIFSDDNTTKCIEVRVIRISPNYMPQGKEGTSDKIGPWNYHDAVSWQSIKTLTVKTSEVKGSKNVDNMEPERPISDRHYKDMCLIALKCKADNTGNIQNQVEKFSVIAQAFSPHWDGYKWLPENIVTKNRYFNGEGEELTGDDAKEQYEALRQSGDTRAECVKGGNNWREIMDAEIFGNKTSAVAENITFNTLENTGIAKYLLDTTEKPNAGGYYPNSSPASQFMLACVGRHLGIDAMGYDRIHLLSMGEWHDQTAILEDGALDDERNPKKIFMTTNGYIYQGQKFDTVLSKIATSGRAGFTLDDNGKLVAVMDNVVSTPDGLFNNQNAISASIVYNYTPAPSGICVTFNNEANYGIAESVLVMLDGEDPKNPRREIEAIQLDFVTTLEQAYSIGRYMLAVRIFGKRALTWKCGIEGSSIQYGSVMRVTHDMLLVGQACGRINGFIESEHYIYGITLSDSYDFDGKDNHAIEIMQPEQYSESKIIIVEVNSGEGLEYLEDTEDHATGDKIPCQCVGYTNTVIFKYPMRKDDTFVSGTKRYYFKPKLGNLVNYGIKDKISDTYRVKSKTPESNFTYSFSLVPYNEAFYKYGAAIPKINRNITIPSRVTDIDISIDNKATLSDLNKRVESSKSETIKYVDDAISKIGGAEPPDAPVLNSTTTYFTEDGIVLSPKQPDGGIKNIINEYRYEVCKNFDPIGENVWETLVTTGNRYYFNRATDGYPEYKGNLENWRIRCKAVNGFGEEYVSEYSNTVAPSGDKYGTWIIPAGSLTRANITTRVSGRNVTLFCKLKYNETIKLYGNTRFRISIKKGDSSSAETEWFRPNVMADPYASEDNYKSSESPNYETVTEMFQQILPLQGQNHKEVVDGELVDAPRPVDTAYGYNIVAVNEESKSQCVIDTPVWIIALATSVKDIADNAITTNKLAEGAVTVEKLHADVLTADRLATTKMTATNATIGKLSDAEISENKNFWDLETGHFRVGNDVNYLEFKKDEEGNDVFELKVDFSKINSTLAVWPTGTDFTGIPAFEVLPDEENPNRGQVTANSKFVAPYISIYGHSTNSSTSVAMALGIDESMWGEGDTEIFIINTKN